MFLIAHMIMILRFLGCMDFAKNFLYNVSSQHFGCKNTAFSLIFMELKSSPRIQHIFDCKFSMVAHMVSSKRAKFPRSIIQKRLPVFINKEVVICSRSRLYSAICAGTIFMARPRSRCHYIGAAVDRHYAAEIHTFRNIIRRSRYTMYFK